MGTRHLMSAAARGIDCILARQRADGSFMDPDDGVGGYYKVPYALALAGRPREGAGLADWIARHHVNADGDFRDPARTAGKGAHDAWPAYANAWLVQGLHRLGRFDLSLSGARFLLGSQLPDGGFPAWDGEARHEEPVCTSWGGMALLATGHLDAARRAGDRLAGMVRSQPDPARLYFRMEVGGGLIADAPAGEELHHFVDSARREQIYYHPGIAMILLAHLHRATGERRWLDACRELFAFAERCADDVYRFPPSGKLGLGCALLFAVTGDAAARRAALAVGDYLVETQAPDGFWSLPDAGPYAGTPDLDGFEICLDITAEFSIFLTEMASLL